MLWSKECLIHSFIACNFCNSVKTVCPFGLYTWRICRIFPKWPTAMSAGFSPSLVISLLFEVIILFVDFSNFNCCILIVCMLKCWIVISLVVFVCRSIVLDVLTIILFFSAWVYFHPRWTGRSADWKCLLVCVLSCDFSGALCNILNFKFNYSFLFM